MFNPPEELQNLALQMTTKVVVTQAQIAMKVSMAIGDTLHQLDQTLLESNPWYKFQRTLFSF